MKIGIVAPRPEPYVFGGAERLLDGLVAFINGETVHDAELVLVPFPERTITEVVAGYERCANLDVARFDLVVSTKYPSWMIEHPRHVVYMLHTLRGLYDTYRSLGMTQHVEQPDAEVADLLALCRGVPDRSALPEIFGRFGELVDRRGSDDELFGFPGPFAREIVHGLDGIGLDLRAVRSYNAISRTIATRYGYFPQGADVRSYHPPSSLRGFHCGEGEYLFTASRLDGPKRIGLLLDAMRTVEADVTLKIAGTGPDARWVQHYAGGDDRIEMLGAVSDEELVDLYAGAIAVPFIPADEDFGLITLEAMCSGKPVVTTTDSGGPTELVVDSVHGFIVPPTAAAVGRALERLVADPTLAREMGLRGLERARQVTWDPLVKSLVREPASRPRSRLPSRPKIVVTSTFPVHPPRGGGQLRCHHLYGSLTRAFDVEIVSLTHVEAHAACVPVADGFVERIVPKSFEHHERELEIEQEIGFPVTDVVAGALTKLSPSYCSALEAACIDASAVLLAHPFMYPVVRALRPDLPVVYDAHNAEYELKDAILPDTRAGDALRDIVRRVEGAAVNEATLVVACSENDRMLLTTRYGREDFIEVANGVDAIGTKFVTAPERGRKSAVYRELLAPTHATLESVERLALFFGSYHPPNLEAVSALLDLARLVPEVGFLIGGSVCDAFWGAVHPANVMLLGVVSDTEKRILLSAADLALNPMRSGSGTNLKVLEYFAAGLPTISTEIGARGIAVRRDRELLISDLAEFPHAIRRVVNYERESSDMAWRARTLALTRYDWRVLGERLLASLAATIPALAVGIEGPPLFGTEGR